MPTETPATRSTTPASQPAQQASPAQQPAPGGQLRWDDSNLKSAYANVCNVSSTREEIVLSFGINQAWERGQNETLIQLSNRVILSPFAAKRLAGLLNNVIQQYESRFGTLSETGRPGDDRK